MIKCIKCLALVAGLCVPAHLMADTTIYYDNSSSKWNDVHIHYWGQPASSWPGVAMSFVGDNIWKFTFTDDVSGIDGFLFCNAGGSSQTSNWDSAPEAGHLYTGSAGHGAVRDLGLYSADGVYCVYFANLSDWNDCRVWAWNAAGNCNANDSWPGDSMTEKDGLMYWQAPAGKIPSQIIISNSGNERAGGDLDFVNGAVYKPSGLCYSLPVAVPEHLYVIGDLAGAQWNPDHGVEMIRDGSKFSVMNVVLAGAQLSYFNLTDGLGANWDVLNADANRFGAPASDAYMAHGDTSPMILFSRGQDASSCTSWSVIPASYMITADFSDMTVKVVDMVLSGVEDIAVDTDVTPVYYNLQGVEVRHPQHGVFIVRAGDSVRKILLP